MAINIMGKIILATILTQFLFSTNSLAADYVSQHDYQQDKNAFQRDITGAQQSAKEAQSQALIGQNMASHAEASASEARKTAQKTADRVTGVENSVKDAKDSADKALERTGLAETTANEAKGVVDSLKGKVDGNASRITQVEESFETTKKGVESNKTAIVKTQKDAKDYTDHTATQTLNSANYYTDAQVGVEATARKDGDRQTLQAAKEYANQKLSQMDKRIGKVRNEANAGTASALAASQIPQVNINSRFSLGAGVGGYNGQSALAVGASAYVNDRTITKFTLTSDSQSDFGFGAGVSVNW